MQSRSVSDQNESEKGTMTLLCGYIAPFMETMWEFSIFAGQLPRGLWKQFRREIKGLQNRFQAWMIKWTFCKTDFTELITTGWLRLSHINKLKSSKTKKKAQNSARMYEYKEKPVTLKESQRTSLCVLRPSRSNPEAWGSLQPCAVQVWAPYASVWHAASAPWRGLGSSIMGLVRNSYTQNWSACSLFSFCLFLMLPFH